MPFKTTSTEIITQSLGASSGTINLQGNAIYYEVKGSGLPIVFLHDGIMHSAGFDSQFADFADQYTVIRYDRPGYGKSLPPNAPYSHVETLKALFDRMNLDSAILVGGSARAIASK